MAHTQVRLHEYIFLISISLDLPAGEKLHDLVALLNFDMTKVVGETLGAQSVSRYQEILQEHWSSSDVTVLPGEDLQHCLLGVSIIYFMWASFISFSIYHHFKTCFKCVDSNPWIPISRPIICWNLLLHLEKSVINLKMDALRLWNIALAGTTCGNLLNLIENAYGYPESKASIERGSYLETVEQDFAENVSDVEPASGIMTKEADVAEMHGEAPPSKRRKKSSQGPDNLGPGPGYSHDSLHHCEISPDWSSLKSSVREERG